ncbi:MAG TPA: flagellar basal body L-ring protein FlgH [Alphaproteobacteria bacterium]|nr:flagellar basal body L-ring protein FlgH [Alphaproteobacteria bacterium]
MTPFRPSAPNALGKLLPAIATALVLSACGAGERIANIGKAPDLSPITNPAVEADYVPVRMPMPAPMISESNPNSLWQAGSRAFFRDHRAARVGDILTVIIEIDDQATINNQTQRSRDNSENAGLPNFLGFESKLGAILPDEVDPSNLVGMNSASNTQGAGSISRGEEIELQLASVVTDILPNGNMVIYGRQEVRVNFEVRELAIAGIIRPEDISSANTISYEKIAEARISYGGRGQISDVQQPRYGQQLYDIIFPF